MRSLAHNSWALFRGLPSGTSSTSGNSMRANEWIPGGRFLLDDRHRQVHFFAL